MSRPAAILSFDVEDWHQLVHRNLGARDWDRPGPAFERQIEAAFALLDELEAKATFFLLGMTLKNYPRIAGEIVARGYETGSHGYAHARVYQQSANEFRADLEQSIEVIGEATGRRPLGYRAPAFSINRSTPWAYEILAELGFRYDSSQYDSPRIPNRIRPVPEAPYRLELSAGGELWEFPIASVRVGGRGVPVGGGAYWRALPAAVLLRAFDRIPCPVLYLHPYELDPLPLRADPPEGLAPRRRLQAASRSLLRNPGRMLVAARLRKVAQHFRLLSYEEAHVEVERRYGASTRALSPEGVLV